MLKPLILLALIILTACIMEAEKVPDQEIPVTCTDTDTTLYQDSTGAWYHHQPCMVGEPRSPGVK